MVILLFLFIETLIAYNQSHSTKTNSPPFVPKHLYIKIYTSYKSPPEESVTTSLISQHAVVPAVLLNCAHTLYFLSCKKWK